MRRRLPSDAEFLLDYMEGLPSYDSDSDFDGYDGLINDDDYLPVLPLQENFENSSSQNYFSTSNTLIPTMHFPDTIVSGLASCSSCILTTTTTTYPVPLTPTTSYTYPIPSIPATAYTTPYPVLSPPVTSHNTPATTDIIYTLPSNNTPTLTTSQTTVSNSNTTLTSKYVIMSSTEV